MADHKFPPGYVPLTVHELAGSGKGGARIRGGDVSDQMLGGGSARSSNAGMEGMEGGGHGGGRGNGRGGGRHNNNRRGGGFDNRRGGGRGRGGRDFDRRGRGRGGWEGGEGNGNGRDNGAHGEGDEFEGNQQDNGGAAMSARPSYKDDDQDTEQ